MVAVYAALVVKGKKTLEEVPEKLREAVKAYIAEHYGA